MPDTVGINLAGQNLAADISYKTLSRLPGPLWKLICSPVLSAGACLMAAIACLPFSFQLSLLFVSVSYVFIAYYIDRKHIGSLIIPPLVLFAVANFFGGNLGATLAAEDIFRLEPDPLLTTQFVYTATFPMLLAVYWLVNRRNAPMVTVAGKTIFPDLNQSQLRFAALIIVLFTFALHCVEISTGMADRGYAGDFVSSTPYGIWSYFEAFSKLQYIAYILIPYLYRTSGKLMRITLVVLFIVLLLFQAANSSRSAIMFPLASIVFGYWMIGGSFWRVFLSLAFLGALMFVITPILGDFRGSGALQTTELKDLGSRLNLLMDTLQNRKTIQEQRTVTDRRVTGIAFLGCTDPLVYANTPSSFPFAGWERIEGVLYVWMPSMFFPNKPSLLDGNDISVMYMGIRHDRSGISPSLQGDLYRRFGWSGILLGYPFYALAVSLLVRYGIRSFNNKQKRLWGLMVILFISTFIHGVPSGTVLTMIWNFLYDYPKYLIVLSIVVLAAKHFARPHSEGWGTNSEKKQCVLQSS